MGYELLYIKPNNLESDTPCVDELTYKMAGSLLQSIRDKQDTGSLTGRVYAGFHRCICGERSSSCDYQLGNDILTNSLSVHYLIWHRPEVPESELARVSELPNYVLTAELQEFVEKYLSKSWVEAREREKEQRQRDDDEILQKMKERNRQMRERYPSGKNPTQRKR